VYKKANKTGATVSDIEDAVGREFDGLESEMDELEVQLSADKLAVRHLLDLGVPVPDSKPPWRYKLVETMLPCPKCKSDDGQGYGTSGDRPKKPWRARCTKCGYEVDGRTSIEVVTRWNTAAISGKEVP
jgi:hypothetical protein